MLKLLKVMLLNLSIIGSCLPLVGNAVPMNQEGEPYTPDCNTSKIMIEKLSAEKMRPIMITGMVSLDLKEEYYIAVWANLAENKTTYLRVNTKDETGCIIGEGIFTLFPLPAGLQII